MSFSIKILGSNSATPAYDRHHTSQYLNIQKHYFLIDCGEGTQMQLQRYKCRVLKVNHIFISHLHGDHYLGLMGLLFTMHLLKRSSDLHLYGPRGLDEIISLQLKYSDSVLNYNLIFHELNPNVPDLIFEDKILEIHSFPLNHRIPCTGFLFREKPKPVRINKEVLPEDLPLQQIARLKKGLDVEDEDGKLLFKNEELTLPPRKSRSYAYCSDTKYDESIIPIIKHVDLLYHEATFLKEKAIWADKTYHSTTQQAGEIAKAAKVEKLIIGHYSARYKDLKPFLEETKQYFKNTVLAIEGDQIEVLE